MCAVSDLLKNDREFVNHLTSEQFLDALVEVFYGRTNTMDDGITENLDKCLKVWNSDRIVDYLLFVNQIRINYSDVIPYMFCSRQWFNVLKSCNQYLEMGNDTHNHLKNIINNAVNKRKVGNEHRRIS